MKKFLCIICFMLLVTGCFSENLSSNIDLTETNNEFEIETSTEIIEDISMTTVTDEQYLRNNLRGNKGDENDCSVILEELPQVVEGKWLVGEEFDLITVGRIEEDRQGNIIEFSAESIKVNDEILQNPIISQDVIWDYNFLTKSLKWNVWKIGMETEDYARYITIEGLIGSSNSEYFIPLLYFDGKLYLMNGCGYYMEKYIDNTDITEPYQNVHG